MWFVAAMRDAASTSDLWEFGSALIVVREIVDGTVEDSDIARSMQGAVDWLMSFLGGKRKRPV